MENVDYIIVGDGYAGMFFAHQLIKNKKSFRLFSESKIAASHISAGVCNPVVLKRFAEIWNAQPQINYLKLILKEIEEYTYHNYLIEEKVARIFHDETEKELWLKKAEMESLNHYLNTEFIKLNLVENKYGTGLVDQSFRLDVSNFFIDMFNILKDLKVLVKEKFDFDYLDLKTGKYKDINFDKIVFADGIAVNSNPYFSTIPVDGNKGHCLKLKLNSNVDDYIIKKKYFLFRFDKENYYYGGTYEKDEKNLDIDQYSIDKLEGGLTEVYKGEYEITKVQTAYRSVVPDRRPIIGRHPEFKNAFILNGLGARGVLNGSYYSKELYDVIEDGKEIDPEVDVKRFYN